MRAVLYTGYKFNNNALFNSELEVEHAVASGLASRYDGGPCFSSQHYQTEIDHLGIARSPAYHYEPETNGCAEKAILRTDRAINAKVKTIFGLMRTRAARRSFISSERAWLRYRNASCTAQASFYDGGSGQPVAYGDCILARNRTHLRDLADLKTTLSQH